MNRARRRWEGREMRMLIPVHRYSCFSSGVCVCISVKRSLEEREEGKNYAHGRVKEQQLEGKKKLSSTHACNTLTMRISWREREREGWDT